MPGGKPKFQQLWLIEKDNNGHDMKKSRDHSCSSFTYRTVKAILFDNSMKKHYYSMLMEKNIRSFLK